MDVIVLGAEGVTVAATGTRIPEEAARVRILRSYAHPGGVYLYRIDWRGRSLV
jgi:hypothetical protein